MRKICLLFEPFVGYRDWYWWRLYVFGELICPRNEQDSRDKTVIVIKRIIRARLTSKYKWETLNLSISTLPFIFVNITAWYKKKSMFLINNHKCLYVASIHSCCLHYWLERNSGYIKISIKMKEHLYSLKVHVWPTQYFIG